METYTIEDIELLRKKGGLTYQEAVALLDYHNGSIARALIDMEKNGRIKEENTTDTKEGERKMNGTGNRSEAKGKALNFIQKLYRSRVKIHKGNTPVFNVSILFGAACLLFAPHMTIAGLILSVILGYRFSFTKMDEDFSSESLEKMVKSAAQNAKSSVNSVVQTISGEMNAAGRNSAVKKESAGEKTTEEKIRPVTEDASLKEAAEGIRKQTKEIEETMDSFFESNPAATTYRSAYSAAASSVPTIQVPVQTETRDGEIKVDDGQDGYSSVTIG